MCVFPVPERLTNARKNGWLPFYFLRELPLRWESEVPIQVPSELKGFSE